MSPNVTYQEVGFFNVTDSTPEPTQAWATLTAGASGTSDAMPPGVALLIFARTAVKRAIGKKFFGGFEEGSWTSVLWAGGLITAAVTAGAAWISSFVGSNGVTVQAGVYRKATGQFIVPTEAVIRVVEAYQRRRKRGIGQ
jgi:hypothetical protein